MAIRSSDSLTNPHASMNGSMTAPREPASSVASALDGYAWPHRLHASILRAYDIRGEYGTTLTETDAYAIGRAFAVMTASRTGKAATRVALARDGRLSSPALAEACAEGLLEGGASVLDIGLAPTPMLYFTAYTEAVDAGLMVTGSHNPPHHNGMKMLINRHAFYGDDIFALGKVAATGRRHDIPASHQPTHYHRNHVTPLYLDALVGALRPGGKELTVVWDPGNGAAGNIIQALVKRLPGTHHVINGTVDGTFPAHHPDPTVEENLAQLRREVINRHAHLGLAFDGDGDRLGVVDAHGRVLWGDQLMMLYAEDVLKEHPGATIMADVKASQCLFEHIAAKGGKPLMWKTGHSLIKAKMAETHAVLAGEMSGHLFFADRYHGFDDGIYAAVRMLDLLSHRPESLAQLRDGLPSLYSTPEIRIDVPSAQKEQIVRYIREQAMQQGAEVSTIDGIRAITKDGWWLVRASNTQAAIVARAEGSTPEALDRLARMLSRMLADCGVHWPWPQERAAHG